MSRTRVAVLASGRGTNLQSISGAVEAGGLDVDLALFLTNEPDAFALKRAARAGIICAVVDHRGLSREEFDRRLAAKIDAADAGLVVLAGFMRILTPWFTQRYRGRLINIHPSLLPAFPGSHAHRDALEYGVRVSGCTVHFVTEQVDGGPVILQEAVPVLQDDTEETLEARVLGVEHRLLPDAVRLFSEGRLRLEGRKVTILDPRRE